MTEPAGHLRAPQCLGRRSLLLGGGAALVLPGQAAARRGASTLGLADTTVRKELARDYAADALPPSEGSPEVAAWFSRMPVRARTEKERGQISA